MRAKIIQAINKNLAQPTGIVGKYLEYRVFTKINAVIERAAVQLCEIQPHHRVLEVGFGPGIGLKEACKCLQGGSGQATGVEISRQMMRSASRRLRSEISLGQAKLIQATVQDLPFNSRTFDRVFHCNVYYFWSDQLRCAKELYRVTKPGGFMVTTINMSLMKSSKEKGFLKDKLTDPVAYMSSLELAGFENIRIEYLKNTDESTAKLVKDYQAIYADVPDVSEKNTKC